MKLRDLAVQVANQMKVGPTVEIDSTKGVKSCPIIDMASGNQRVFIETGGGLLIFERLGRRHRVDGITYRMVHKGHEVVRIFRGRKLGNDGVVNGVYVDDVELTCTELAFPTGISHQQSNIQI